jgi:predicted TIM-barrel fold metal-dependent hydrolase
MSVKYQGISYRVADAHAHIYPGKIAEKATASVGVFYHLKMENVGLPHALKEAGEQAGVEKYLVSSVATKLEQVHSISDFIAEKCEKYPEFIGLAAWHQDVTDLDGEFDRIMSLGLKGIKLHPDFQRFDIDDPKMMDVYREAHRRKLPVLFHTGDNRTEFSSPARLARVIDKIPEFTCIAAHLGGYRRWSEAMHILSGANVYIDTCSSLAFVTPEEARESIAHFGAHRTMFGTDFPMWSPDTELERFFHLALTPEENKQILYDTFAQLFGLADEPEKSGL